MIALQSVTKQFQHRSKAVTALAGVSLEIAKGDFVAVIGPSGSGKSTFLHLQGAMLSPTEGKVRIENDSLYDLTSDQRSARCPWCSPDSARRSRNAGRKCCWDEWACPTGSTTSRAN
jgi:ABC-type nitrate/sulfonate/bicarbonate transport system ATPase subunit